MNHFFKQLQTAAFWQEGAVPLVLFLSVYYGIWLVLRKLYSRGWIKNIWLQTWRNLGWLAYVIALYPLLIFFFPRLSQSLSSFGSVFTSPLFNTESGPSLVSLFLLIPIFFVAGRLAAGLVKLLELHLDRNRVLQKRVYKNNIKTLLTIAHYILLLLFWLFGINLIGVDISSLGVILGALGLGIGLGLQNMAANFLSGITLLLSGHIQSGDFIRTSRALGTIERIGLLSTIVLTTEYENLIIPNQYLLNEIIENASYDNNRVVQLHLPIGVSYESNLDVVVQLLTAVLERNPFQPLPTCEDDILEGALDNEREGMQNSSLQNLPPTSADVALDIPEKNNNPAVNAEIENRDKYLNQVWLKGFGASAIDFEVRMMIEDINRFRAATHWFYMEVWRTFKEHGVVIPFSQLDIHVNGARIASEYTEQNEHGQK